MGLIVSSIFRNSEDYIDRYVAQLADLERVAQEDLKMIVAEGDSTDNTWDLLHDALPEATILKVDHGGPEFSSVDDPQRWAQIALVCNAVMEEVSRQIQPTDDFVYVESDLVWAPDTICELIEDLEHVDAVAPMSILGRTGQFYDIWGYRKNGVPFTHNPPYHPELNGSRLVEIDSAGSCFVMRGHLVPAVRFGEEDCIRGVGRTLRAAGSSLWLDQSCEVIHP